MNEDTITTLPSRSETRTSKDTLKPHKDFLFQRKKNDVWDFLGNGWLDQAMELITGDEGTGWYIYADASDLRAMSSCQEFEQYPQVYKKYASIIHFWATVTEHEKDEIFLDLALKELGVTSGNITMERAMDKLKNNSPSEVSGDLHIEDGVVRMAAKSRNWKKVNLLLKRGATWGNAHAEAVLCALSMTSGSYYDNRDSAMKAVRAMLRMKNSKDWVNEPFQDPRYRNRNTNALECALNSKDFYAKELVDLLLKAGADINARVSSNGDTILHRVMNLGRQDVPYKLLAKRIVSLGGNISAKNDEGKTPLNILLDNSNGKRSVDEIINLEREWLMKQIIQSRGGTKKAKLSNGKPIISNAL